MLGSQHAGTLLLAWPGGSPSDASSKDRAGPAPSPLSWPEAVCSAVSCSVAQAAFGPDLGPMTRLCAAACTVSCAPSLHMLGCSVMGQMLDLLASEFHLDLGVQLALVPRGSSWGVMLVQQAAAGAAAGCVAGVGTPQQPQQLQGASTSLAQFTAAAFGDGSGSAAQWPMVPGCSSIRLERGGLRKGGGGGTGGGAPPPASGTSPRTNGPINADWRSGNSTSTPTVAAGAASAGGAANGSLRVNGSPMPSFTSQSHPFAGSNPNIYGALKGQTLKAYPFALSSTLLKRLLLHGAAVAPAAGITVHDCRAHLQDSDQQRGDLVLLARRSAISPASMVLVAAGAPQQELPIGGGMGGSASRQSTGMGYESGRGPAVSATVPFGNGPVEMHMPPALGLYLLAGPDRLPHSLLQAVQGRAEQVLPLFLPGVHTALSGPVLDEWLYLGDSVQPNASAAAAAAAIAGSNMGMPGSPAQPGSGLAAGSMGGMTRNSFTSAMRAAAALGSARRAGVSGGGPMSNDAGIAAASAAPPRLLPLRTQGAESAGDLHMTERGGRHGEWSSTSAMLSSRSTLMVHQQQQQQQQQALNPPRSPSQQLRKCHTNLPLTSSGTSQHAGGFAAGGGGSHSVILSASGNVQSPQGGITSIGGPASGTAGANIMGTGLEMDPIMETALSVILDLPPAAGYGQHAATTGHCSDTCLLGTGSNEVLRAVGGAPGAAGCVRPAAAHMLAGQGSHLPSGSAPGFGDSASGRLMWQAPVREQMDLLVSSFRGMVSSVRDEGEIRRPHADDDLRALELLHVLGRGGAGTVYAGRLHGLDVAVKLLDPPNEQEAMDQANRQRRHQQQTSPQQQLVGGHVDEAPSAVDVAQQLQLRSLMRGARELAVMSLISHPSIIQVFSYHTSVSVVKPAGGAGVPKLDVAHPDAAGPTSTDPTYGVVVMELCELGSLADAIDVGLFFVRGPSPAAAGADAAQGNGPKGLHALAAAAKQTSGGGAGALAAGGFGMGALRLPNMRAIHLTLLEVALALRHLHGMRLVHCDLKPANVLLKSSPVTASDPRGFTAKLTDFGFVALMQQQQPEPGTPESAAGDAGAGAAKQGLRFHEPVGTVTHMAPETFIQGRVLDSSLDVYALGIIMWELYTGKAPYAAEAQSGFKEVPYKVVKKGLRPVFPPETPTQYRQLAQSCWATEPHSRPSAASVVALLQAMMRPAGASAANAAAKAHAHGLSAAAAGAAPAAAAGSR